jgi:hypothetical protein
MMCVYVVWCVVSVYDVCVYGVVCVCVCVMRVYGVCVRCVVCVCGVW